MRRPHRQEHRQVPQLVRLLRNLATSRRHRHRRRPTSMRRQRGRRQDERGGNECFSRANHKHTRRLRCVRILHTLGRHWPVDLAPFAFGRRGAYNDNTRGLTTAGALRGTGGIRTPGAFRLVRFQGGCIRPLCHRSTDEPTGREPHGRSQFTTSIHHPRHLFIINGRSSPSARGADPPLDEAAAWTHT